MSVVGNSVMEQQARPGERYTGVIRLQNASDEPQDVKVYVTDYTARADGATVYGEPGAGARSNAKWIALSPSYLSIPPRQTTEVRYAVTVPQSQRGVLTGTYWSMVMVEGIPRGSAESARSGARSKQVEVGVVTRLRYAVQLVTHVPNSGTSKLEFAAPKVLAAKDGRRVLQFDIVNTGERAYRPEIAVELYTQGGAPVGKFKQPRELTYPGGSLRQSFDLTAVRPGKYKALVVVDTGAEDVFGAQFNLTF